MFTRVLVYCLIAYELSLMTTISIFGGGVMGSALAKILSQENFQVIVADPDQNKLALLEAPIETTAKNPEAAYRADVLLLAVKPQDIESLFSSLKQLDLKNRLIISIAAGLPIAKIQKGLNVSTVVRAMPNTPALLAESATAYVASPEVSNDQLALSAAILNSFGLSIRVETEKELDVISGISGSGPAYFFLFFEELIKAGEKLGVRAEILRPLILQTAVGSAELAQNSADSLEILRQRVTSKGGITAEALKIFEQKKFGAIVESAIQAAHKRAKELGLEKVRSANVE
jgi:pyrroline-5-carboxylate reductase